MGELFPTAKDHVFKWDEPDTVQWLIEMHKCTEAVKPYVHGLFAEFDTSEAFERCKALPSLDGLHQVDGWTLQDGIDYYEMYSHDLDYHCVLDRAWAARQGLAKDDVLLIDKWDYQKREPIFKADAARYLCDVCGNQAGRYSLGNYCCLAPGMARITYKRRKQIRYGEEPLSVCKFYKPKRIKSR